MTTPPTDEVKTGDLLKFPVQSISSEDILMRWNQADRIPTHSKDTGKRF